ncbi:J domain-containing protein, partial [Curvivirga aplysinae]|uniref:J domain-containing protein n=1 Tax=Curvivirga aplysinae TaxID=2529852 RepID=UPI002E27324D
MKAGAAFNDKGANVVGDDKSQDDSLVEAIRAVAKVPSQRKVSYAIPCASEFRDRVSELAERRNVNVGDIARSVMLTLPEDVIDSVSDPGEPDLEDRETIILKSGPSAGKPWRRKPRLQVRMPAGYDMVTIRKALALALQLDDGTLTINLEDPLLPKKTEQSEADREQIIRLHTIITAMSFDLLKGGVQTHEEALYVLGFPPTARPNMDEVKQRFRLMATIHHPDSELGGHERMAQLNDAISLLRRTIL